MTLGPDSIHVAVIGSGMAGSACAAGLRSAGTQVTLFEKSTTVGGRMATRCASWTDGDGAQQSVTFDHGAHCFTRTRPRFKAAMSRAIAVGCVSEWRPRVHTAWPVEAGRCLVATPTMPALCGHLLAGMTVHLNRTVQRLQRAADGSWYVATDGAPLAGPFHSVAMAIPPAQAALLLAGHQDSWTDALMARRMQPCWTLTAVTDDVDWPWDAAEPDRGPLATVLRNDRVPGRTAPAGLAVWTAHATAEWSAAHLEDEPQAASAELQSALQAQLPTMDSGGRSVRWHHVSIHRWRYARPAVDCNDRFERDECWWDETLGLGVCGDFFKSGGVEEAWQSGDELADCMAVSFERTEVAGRDGATLIAPSRATSSISSPVTHPSAPIHQASLRLISPLRGGASHFSGTGLKVSRRSSFSDR
jgi:renalase